MAKTNAARILDRLHITYMIKTYPVDKSNLSAEHVAQLLDMPAEQVFKTLVARTDKRAIVLACIPGNSELDLKALGAGAGGKRAELVALKEVQLLTGYIRGGVSPLGTKKPLPVYIDQSAKQWSTLSNSAGQRGTQILIAPDDLCRAANAILCNIVK